ncbi:hypothetical protein ACP4OV_011015 [Aristida adscensionis]
MEQPRNGGGIGKVVTFEQPTIGRRRSGPVSTYLDVGRELDASRVARPLPPLGAVSRRRTYADGELDVFAAERYFKGAMDGGGDRREGVAAAVAVPVEKLAATASPAVPVAAAKPSSARSVSASSAASATSQTLLLRGGGHRRHGCRDKKCCVQVGVLMRTCSGKRSVRVDGGAAKEVQVTGEPAASRIDWYRELRMQKASLGLAGDGSHGVVAAGLPPNLNLGAAKVAAIGREMTREEKAAEFTCSSSRRRSFTLRASPAAIGRGVDSGGGCGGGGGDKHDDGDDDGAGSESSSDLFEIKSLMIDDCPYEPSEASIQWSVVTASAADPSERGDRAAGRWITGGSNGGRVGGRVPAVAARKNGDRPVGLLSGCVSHRAVDVSATTAPSPNRPATVATRRRNDGVQKARSGA